MNIIPSLQERLFTPSANPFSTSAASVFAPDCEVPALRTDETAAFATSPDHGDRCITVMLVEERTLVRQGINALLAHRDDITVIGEAPDCRQAFALAKRLRPDVVIIALSLVLRNGLESLRRILAAGGHTRVLVLVPHHHGNVLPDHVAISGTAGFLTEQAGAQLLTTALREIHTQNPFADTGKVPPAEATPNRRRAGPETNFPRLTSRELEVLQLIAEGNANKQTASKLGISIKTVEKHRQHMMTKLGIHETATLTRFAVYAGIA